MIQSSKQKYIYTANIMKQVNNEILLHQENAILFKVGSSYINLKNIHSWMDFLGTISINPEKMLTRPTIKNNLFIDETTLKVYEEEFIHNLNSYIIKNSDNSHEFSLLNRLNQEISSQEGIKRR